MKTKIDAAMRKLADSLPSTGVYDWDRAQVHAEAVIVHRQLVAQQEELLVEIDALYDDMMRAFKMTTAPSANGVSTSRIDQSAITERYDGVRKTAADLDGFLARKDGGVSAGDVTALIDQLIQAHNCDIASSTTTTSAQQDELIRRLRNLRK